MLTRNRIRFVLLLFSVCWFSGTALAQIGSRPAGFRLTDAAGRIHTMEEYAGRILVLEFWSFKCPVALAYDARMRELGVRFADRGVAFLGVASSKNESAEEIRRNAENLKIPFPILLDQDGSFADAVGATHAPSVVVLDASGTIRYRGAIDNNRRAGENGRIPYLEDALAALVARKAVNQPETKVFGCTIRR